MRPTLVGLNPDLNRLWDEGYALALKGREYLMVHNIPYYTTTKQVKRDGIFLMTLELAGDKTVNPVTDHTSWFIGEKPADEHGNPFYHIIDETTQNLRQDLTINFRFSSKPFDRPNHQYYDYYDKVRRYVTLLMSAAYAHDKMVTATGLRVFVPEEEKPVFVYADTNSSRAQIETISERLRGQKIGIVGIGGTGSYVLDFVSKTLVGEIHLFDADYFRNHNAFRAPGAAPKEILSEHPKKVEYFHMVYSKMHLFVCPHDVFLDQSNVQMLDGLDFVFLCMDANPQKKDIVGHLIKNDKPFIDVGVGLVKANEELFGHVRTSTVTKSTKDYVQRDIPFKSMDDQYNNNIQIAELNAINACLAVIKWKKMFGVYSTSGDEYQSIYSIKSNKIFNEKIDPTVHGNNTERD